jgi:hypothetical protein
MSKITYEATDTCYGPRPFHETYDQMAIITMGDRKDDLEQLATRLNKVSAEYFDPYPRIHFRVVSMARPENYNGMMFFGSGHRDYDTYKGELPALIAYGSPSMFKSPTDLLGSALMVLAKKLK